MTTATITAPATTTLGIEELDFVPTCHAYSKSKGDHCDDPAVAYIEFHRVGQCKAEECNAAGNVEGNVCQEHLDFFMQIAVDIVNHEYTQPALPRMFPSQTQLVCGTCRMPINKASDILQKVVRF